jgi:excisionase family DNA binding protein
VSGTASNSRLLTAREVADRYGHHPETILRWYRRGEMDGIAFRTPGGRLRFREDRLDAWEEERATPSRGVSTTPEDAAQRLGYLSSTTPEVEED